MRIMCSLGAGSVRHKSFKALALTTGLSNTWTSKILKEMIKEGLVAHEGRFYTLTQEGEKTFNETANYAYPIFLLEKVSLFAEAVARDPDVQGMILFGSLPRGEAKAGSDADLFVVVKDGRYRAKLEEEIRESGRDFEVFGELLVVERSSLIKQLERNAPLLLGILRGYKILFDSERKLADAIGGMEKRALGDYEYVEEGRVWVKR